MFGLGAEWGDLGVVPKHATRSKGSGAATARPSAAPSLLGSVPVMRLPRVPRFDASRRSFWSSRLVYASLVCVFRFRGTTKRPLLRGSVASKMLAFQVNKSSLHLVSSSSFAPASASVYLGSGTRAVPGRHHPRKIAVRNARVQCAPLNGRKVGWQRRHVANEVPGRPLYSGFQLPTGSLTKPDAVICSSGLPLEWVLIDRSDLPADSPPVLALSPCWLPRGNHGVLAGETDLLERSAQPQGRCRTPLPQLEPP
ncbi:uncharacterized protein B0H64DRAFT_87514 [Chaetomium fimeti]|uniref:Uncharacterized protein n=1 Tax=Chaetomium fimeti TaxID=1854472 RepID=A0AAE0LVB2_9PEZI|nr:hypothetical protein B0H64DRAFT_87514 [Chaetomium fimeti]